MCNRIFPDAFSAAHMPHIDRVRVAIFVFLNVRVRKRLGVQVIAAIGLRRLDLYIMRAFTLMGGT